MIFIFYSCLLCVRKYVNVFDNKDIILLSQEMLPGYQGSNMNKSGNQNFDQQILGGFQKQSGWGNQQPGQFELGGNNSNQSGWNTQNNNQQQGWYDANQQPNQQSGWNTNQQSGWNSNQQSGWNTNQQSGWNNNPQLQKQATQTYHDQQFPKTISDQQIFKGTSGWDALFKPGDSNPYSKWDQIPEQVIYNQNNKHNMQLKKKDSIWDQIGLNKSINFILNPVFKSQPPKYEFPSPFMRYKIIPYLDEKMALDVTSVNEKKLKKNNLIIWDYHGGPNQLFFINKKKNGKYSIVNTAKGFTVEVPESETKEGVQIYANPRNDTENQYWQLKPGRKPNTYQIVSFCGKVLDCEGQSTKNGTRVIQWTGNDGKNQLWKIVPA